MNIKGLQVQISLGEDCTRQFKTDVRNAASLAFEMAAFANSEGGTNCLGVADELELVNISSESSPKT